MPHTKVLRYKFEPDVDPVNCPGGAQAEMLATGTGELNVVVEGRVSLTKNQAIKLPEFVPFVILRDPPGDGSFATYVQPRTHHTSLKR